MKRTTFVIAAIIATTIGIWAGPALASSEVDARGYRNCEQALSQEFRGDGLAVKRRYYLEKSADEKTYFINGTVWAADDSRTSVRLSCRTSANGRLVLGLETDFGKYTMDDTGIAIR